MMTFRSVRYALIDLKDWFAYRSIPLAALIAPSIVGLAMGVALWRTIQQTQVEPQPIVVIATPSLPTAQPTEPPIEVAAVHFVTAYDSPNGTAFPDPIPVPPLSAVVARWGSEWVMVPWGNIHIWLLAADVGLPNVADLEPAPQPVVIERPIYVSAPALAVATPEPVYEPMSLPEAPPPAPAPVVQASEFVQPDRATSCDLFLGCLPGR